MKLNCIFRGHQWEPKGRPFIMGYLRGLSVIGQVFKCNCCGKEKTEEV